MPSGKKTTRELHAVKENRRKRFPSFDGVLAESQYRMIGGLRDPHRTLASHLVEAVNGYRDASELSVYRLRKNEDNGVQLEHHSTIMKLGQTVKIFYEGDHIKDLHHNAMISIDQERVRYFVFDEGTEWSFSLNVGEVEPERFSFKKVSNRGCEVFIPIVSEGRNGKEIMGMLVIKGGNLSLRGSRNKTGKRAVQESAMHGANIMSVVSHLFSTKLDGLTGLPTKQDFKRDLERALDEYSMKGTTFCLIMLDMDHFKFVNDVYGHLAGDEVLASFSRLVRNFVRDTTRYHGGSPDVVYRWGGEEFFVILKGVDRNDALAVAERIRRETENTKVRTDNGIVSMSCSCGVVSIEDVEEKTSESVEKLADLAMYRAKRSGRNRVYWVEQTKTGLTYKEYTRKRE